MDEGFGLDVVYLDYRKAFTSVPHHRLLEKLKGLRIKGKLLQWLEDFLTSRTMRVGKRHTFTNTNGPQWSSTRQRIRTTALLVVCE